MASHRRWCVWTWAVLMLLAAGPGGAARAVTFTQITANGGLPVAPQLSFTVSSAATGLVRFSFQNAGPVPSGIAEIYFDDRNGLLAGIEALLPGEGVRFTGAHVRPPDLPGGTELGVPFDTTHLVGAVNPQPTWSINPGEALGVEFSLTLGAELEDLTTALGSGALRVGLHVVGIADPSGGGDVSNSFVSNPPITGGRRPPPPPPNQAAAAPVPEPAGALLVFLALTGAALRVTARRRA